MLITSYSHLHSHHAIISSTLPSPTHIAPSHHLHSHHTLLTPPHSSHAHPTSFTSTRIIAYSNFTFLRPLPFVPPSRRFPHLPQLSDARVSSLSSRMRPSEEASADACIRSLAVRGERLVFSTKAGEVWEVKQPWCQEVRRSTPHKHSLPISCPPLSSPTHFLGCRVSSLGW